MADDRAEQIDTGLPQAQDFAEIGDGRARRRFDWKTMLSARKTDTAQETSHAEEGTSRNSKWHMGMLNTETEEVPGSVLLLSKVSEFNEPLGMQNAPARTSASSFPQSPRPGSRSSSLRSSRRRQPAPEKKKTADGKFVLEPQPDDSLNDPLNWATWRRDAALLSLGFYCMLGGGMTPILAAGFHDVAEEYNVSEPQVALTTGLYMMGLGLGSVVLSPTAILYGKRPVYLVAALCFVLSSIWCALSPNFASLVCARIFQGFAVSSVECLPSATVAEIYFLHEKAYRLGIYTLLLLGGKNLVPLVSAAVIQSLGWRWVFWVVAIIVGFAWILLLVFVPETVWDRTPVPHKQKHRLESNWSMSHVFKSPPTSPTLERKSVPTQDEDLAVPEIKPAKKHAHFAGDASDDGEEKEYTPHEKDAPDGTKHEITQAPLTQSEDYFSHPLADPDHLEAQSVVSAGLADDHDPRNAYTKHNSAQPPKTWLQQLRPYSGRLSHSPWLRVMVRPFILFAYPSILWSALVYSLSIGWLIVLSESVSYIYISRDSYNFTSLQAGLVYISPFVGGILGTAVAGKVSDLIVRWLARRNGGIYEPEFRLIMAVPIAITTVIGLMGYGWSVQERDAWIVPTIFFGFISFGCSLGSTTSITFAVDSYRQYAGEALVTLNFSKNICHGLVFSLFFNKWLESEGSKDVFIAIGGIQLACMLTTIPMYVYGKRARMWTVRKNIMEKF
ncbi:putative major facilitator superfamily, MFS transporter superfamily [Septoria linicola]|nr:putative major facilitator superfamily, MFS transporter superfamily [Septoria linicola]